MADDQRRALHSDDATRDSAATPTPDDVARLPQSAPASVRRYLQARPMGEQAPTDSEGEE